MAFWNRDKPYDRTKILDGAEKARSKGRYAKAIAEYQKVLAADPDDAHVNARIAPLLVKAKRPEEAAKAFEAAARTFIAKGFVDKAMAVYVQASAAFPFNDALYTRIADLSMERGRKADAVKALVRGATVLVKKKPHRPQAIALLERAVGLEPLHLSANIELARALAKDGRKADGLARLESLAASMAGAGLKKVRGAMFKLSPTPAALWRWMRVRAG